MAASKLSRGIASRAVHVQITPCPRNLHESKTLLRELQEFGELDSYRLLAQDSSESEAGTILAVFRHDHAASNLLSNSPLKLEISLQRPATRGILGMSALRIDANAQSKSAAPNSSNSNLDGQEQQNKVRTFTLTTQPSRFDHYGHIRRQEYYWGYKHRTRSISQEQLSRNAPVTSLATMSHPQSTVLTRLVNKRMTDLRSHRSVKALWDELNHSKPEKPLKT